MLLLWWRERLKRPSTESRHCRTISSTTKSFWKGFALDAFEQAAAANLPAVLSEATYKQRPELLEAGVNAAWLLMPLRGRKQYKRM